MFHVPLCSFPSKLIEISDAFIRFLLFIPFWRCDFPSVLSLYNASLPPSPMSCCAFQSSLSCQIQLKIELGAPALLSSAGTWLWLHTPTDVSYCSRTWLSCTLSPLPAHGASVCACKIGSVCLQEEGAGVDDTLPLCLRFNCQVGVWQPHPETCL